MDHLYREFQVDSNDTEGWIEHKLDQIFGPSWRLQMNTDEEEEDEISYEMMKRFCVDWIQKNHPMKSKSNGKYTESLFQFIQKKKEWVELSRRVVFDEWMGRRIRKMKRSKEAIHFHLSDMEKMDLEERLDQIEDTINEMDRAFMRDYSSKEQMEYFNDLFTHQVANLRVKSNNPFDAFYTNPTSHISDTYSLFDKNDRYLKEEEMNYEDVSKRKEATIQRPDGLTLDNFNEMFEKQKKSENGQMSGLDAFFETNTIQGSSMEYQNRRPMTIQEMEKSIQERLFESDFTK